MASKAPLVLGADGRPQQLQTTDTLTATNASFTSLTVSGGLLTAEQVSAAAVGGTVFSAAGTGTGSPGYFQAWGTRTGGVITNDVLGRFDFAGQTPSAGVAVGMRLAGVAGATATNTQVTTNLVVKAVTVAGVETDLLKLSSAGTITLANWNGGTITVGYGGTGQTSYAVGDILYASATTSLSKLAAVATGNVLISGGVTTAPSWGKVGLTTHVSGTLGYGNGGTGATSYTTGRVPYAGASAFASSGLQWDNTNSRLGGNVTPSYPFHWANASASGSVGAFFTPSLASGSPTDVLIGKAAASYQSLAVGYQYSTSSTSCFGYLLHYGDTNWVGINLQAGGRVSCGAASWSGALTVWTLSVFDVGLVVEGKSGQAADLQQWKNGGTVKTLLDASGRIQADAGSATAPAYGIYNDSNTGVYGISSDVLGVTTGGAECWRWDSSGNAVQRRDAGTTNAPVLAQYAAAGDAVHHPVIVQNQSRGTIASPTATVTGDFVGEIRFSPYQGSYLLTAAITGQAEGTVTTGVCPTYLGFWTGSNAGARAERLQIGSTGAVRTTSNGWFSTKRTSAPADADIATGECAWWFDSTSGAAKLMVKGKDSGGTVRTGSVTLT